MSVALVVLRGIWGTYQGEESGAHTAKHPATVRFRSASHRPKDLDPVQDDDLFGFVHAVCRSN